IGPKDVLDTCQALYETHKLTTYPRSDCSYLPEGHFGQASTVAAAIAATAPHLSALAAGADLKRRSRAWNDGKITAHHAIIPTPTSRPAAGLTERERGIYDLIARRYLAQFFPAFEYDQTQIEAAIAGETFAATGRQIVAEGWRIAIGRMHD